MFTLTIDIAGPVKPGLDCTSKGTQGKGMMVFKIPWTLKTQAMDQSKAKGQKHLLNYHHVKRGTTATSQALDQSKAKGQKHLLNYHHVKRGTIATSQALDQSKAKGQKHLLNYHHVKRGTIATSQTKDQSKAEGEQGRDSKEDVPGEQGREGGDDDDQVVEQPSLIGATEKQKEILKDYECSEYEPSLPGDDEGVPHDEDQPDPGEHDREGGLRPDCEPPESTVLMFAKALKTNAGTEVKSAIQDIVLYLDAHGLPTYRFHADRGECFSHSIRGWLRDRHIKASWSEAGVPQGNGRAEAAVRWVKAFETKWIRGRYVGLSNLLEGGHVVHVPESEAKKGGGFLPELVEMKVLALNESELGAYAKTKAKLILEDWDVTKATELVGELGEAGFFEDKKFGVYRHGGSVGWMKGLPDHPELGTLLAKIILEFSPEATFTSIMVSKDCDRGYHKDTNNDSSTKNYIVPIRTPERGGALWVELRPGDLLVGDILQRADRQGRVHYGQVHEMKEGRAVELDPRRAHEVLPWALDSYGYPTPLSQLPEYFVKVPESGPKLDKVEVQEEPVTDNDEGGSLSDDDWEMFVEAEKGCVKVGTSSKGSLRQDFPRVNKTEVTYTKDVEQILANLTEPLRVTYTVDPREALLHLDEWKEAIAQEVKGIEVAIRRLMPGTPERALWLQKKGVQRLPTKLVYTIKPNDAADPADKKTWFRRKARLVVCGNMATSSMSDYYCETAPTEAVRAGLAMSRSRCWQVALIDVVAAFILTPIGESARDPVIVVCPPKVLERLSLTLPQELWGLIRALYGLREAPMLWSAYRDRTLASMVTPSGWRLKQGRTVTCWWVVTDESGDMKALIIIYVDDMLIIGLEDAVMEVANLVQSVWATSPLTFLRRDNPLRFLGMELSMTDDESMILVGQQAYIEELCRNYGVQKPDKIPVSKETASFSVMDGDMEADEGGIAQAQRVTGELLWISQKTRPDLSYGCSLLSSLTLKAPYRAVEVGTKMIRYLYGTKTWRMAFRKGDNTLTMFPDAAFAPESERSHTGWLVVWGKNPIAWRSSRQPTIALSTAEAELTAILEGAVALLGIETLLVDLSEEIEVRRIVCTDHQCRERLMEDTSS
ncbi:GIP [Symbiodinium sp. CCMP2592]|nr:GIP [Symbiodinium sp. CCMP2592]